MEVNWKLEIAKRSYEEVLDATKHQDDKIGRILTAIAFLTTGAITTIGIFSKTNVILILPDGRIEIVWILLGIYIACTGVAVIQLLLALTVPLVILGKLNFEYRSLIFYSDIQRQTSSEWKSFVLKSNDDDLAQNYLVESLNLSRRVMLKYLRTTFAVRIFRTGVLYLVLGILALLVATSQPYHSTAPITFSPTAMPRIILLIGAAGFLLLESVAIVSEAKNNWRDWPEVDANGEREVIRLKSTITSIVIALISVFLLEIDAIWAPIQFKWLPFITILVAGFFLIVWGCKKGAYLGFLASIASMLGASLIMFVNRPILDFYSALALPASFLAARLLRDSRNGLQNLARTVR